MDIWDKVDFNLFPSTLQELACHVGEDGMRALARDYRGQRIYVPKSRLENHFLLNTLSKEALIDWSHAQGGLYFHVPLCKSVLDERRNSEIKEKRASGWSFCDLMSHFNLSRATLQLIVN